MTGENLAALLAKRVMGWGVGPDRFLIGNRGWMPRWRFQPTEKLPDALRLLEKAAPEEYNMYGDSEGRVRVHVRIGDSTGEACEISKAFAITHAIARAVGIEVESSVAPRCPMKHPPLRRHSSPGTRAADTKRRGQL